MAYIGPPPSQKLATPTSQYFSGNGSATSFTLNRPVNVAEDLNVYVNNVAQQPGVGKSYTATGTTLTFDAAPASGTNNVYVVYRGLSEGTLRLEGTTTGIDDNADATAITISSGELVGIGETSPTSALHIKGGAGTNLAIQSTAGTHWRIGDGVGSTNGNLVIYDYTDSRKVFEIDTLGHVTKPAQPAFSAYFNGNNNGTSTLGGGGGQIVLNATKFNTGNHYSTSTGRFTAPVAGTYQFNTCLFGYNQGLVPANSSTATALHLNGALNLYLNYNQITSSTSYPALSGSAVLYLNANEYVTLHTTAGVYTDTSNKYAHWSGYLIG